MDMYILSSNQEILIGIRDPLMVSTNAKNGLHNSQKLIWETASEIWWPSFISVDKFKTWSILNLM